MMALLAVLMVSVMVLAACGGEPATSSVDVASPSPTASAKPSASPKPSAAPSASPTLDDLIATPLPGPEEVPEFAGSFKDLADENDMVIRGKFTKKLPDLYNAIRSLDDPADPDPVIFIEEEMYEFTVTEVYKENKELTTQYKKGDVIIINTPFNDIYTTGQTPKKDPRYMDIELNQEVVLFLFYADIDPKNPTYRQDSSLYMFKVEDERLFPLSYDEKLIEEWNEATGGDEGIPVANLKKDLGVK
jgi:hypothetical protein